MEQTEGIESSQEYPGFHYFRFLRYSLFRIPSDKLDAIALMLTVLSVLSPMNSIYSNDTLAVSLFENLPVWLWESP